jgi:hypothetical protein
MIGHIFHFERESHWQTALRKKPKESTMKKSLLNLVLILTLAMLASSVILFAADDDSLHGKPEPQAGGIHWARGNAPGHAGRPAKSPNLSWHGGPIMVSAQVKAIFWGQSWADAGQQDKINGLDSFYSGMGGTAYDRTSDEYTDATGNVTDAISYSGHLIDTSQATGGKSTSAILGEVCKMISNPISNGYYPVYVDVGRGHSGFCAWHSVGTCGGVMVQFAFFFDLDGDVGCDPNDNASVHSEGLAALANVSGHELSEARTDPHLNAWLDSSGEENADKCAWSFGPTLVPFNNGTSWKLQGNWSNSAYNSTTRGYDNSSAQKGCIDGGTFN